jgi:hypothetical protein
MATTETAAKSESEDAILVVCYIFFRLALMLGLTKLVCLHLANVFIPA